MKIETLFSTKERIRILNRVIYKTGYISVNSIAREAKLSKGLISKYLKYLAKEGLLKRVDRKLLVKDSIKTRAVRIFLNLSMLDDSFFRKYRFVKGVGLYGSLARGTNTEDSDIDLWICTERASEEDMARLTASLKRRFGNVKPLYLTKEKINLLKRDDSVFYHSLVFGSILVYGGGIEAV
jgi:predicted nucleotidyltransferase